MSHRCNFHYTACASSVHHKMQGTTGITGCTSRLSPRPHTKNAPFMGWQLSTAHCNACAMNLSS